MNHVSEDLTSLAGLFTVVTKSIVLMCQCIKGLKACFNAIKNFNHIAALYIVNKSNILLYYSSILNIIAIYYALYLYIVSKNSASPLFSWRTPKTIGNQSLARTRIIAHGWGTSIFILFFISISLVIM